MPLFLLTSKLPLDHAPVEIHSYRATFPLLFTVSITVQINSSRFNIAFEKKREYSL
jgi:hypothetical protein